MVRDWAMKLMPSALAIAVIVCGVGSAAPVSRWTALQRVHTGALDDSAPVLESTSCPDAAAAERTIESEGPSDAPTSLVNTLPRFVPRIGAAALCRYRTSQHSATTGECSRE